MNLEADRVREALRGTMLESLSVVEVCGVVEVEGVPGEHRFDYWAAARDALAPVGRRPVVVEPWEDVHEPDAEPLSEVEARARTADPSQVFARWENDLLEPVSYLVEWLADTFPGRGLDRRAVLDLPAEVTPPVVDRWIFEHLLAEPDLLDVVRPKLQAGAPQPLVVTHPVTLAVLPTAVPWMAGAWIDYYGVEYQSLPAALRVWNERWGAELVAAWGTMLELVVSRRPEFGEESWELADQILALAGSLQVSQWELAVTLPLTEVWFLHNRP